MLNGASGFLNRLKIMIGDSNRYFVQVRDYAIHISWIIMSRKLRIEFVHDHFCKMYRYFNKIVISYWPLLGKKLLPWLIVCNIRTVFLQDGMCKITHILLKNILRQHGKIRYVEPVSKITFNDDRAYVSTTRNYFRYTS